jgi:hypothetical protein
MKKGGEVIGKIIQQQQQQIILDTNNRAYFNFINSIRSPSSRTIYEFTIKKYMQYYNIQKYPSLDFLYRVHFCYYQ